MRARSHIKLVLLVSLSLSACGENNKDPGSSDLLQGYQRSVESLAAEIQQAGLSLSLRGQEIANLASGAEIVSDFGSFQRGRTLNYFTSGGVSFIVYGEDGVFAAECEASGLDPAFGPGHPKCQVAHAESYDRFILCFPTFQNIDVAVAQAWPGTSQAFSDGLGLTCWDQGVKMLSNRIFTY